MPGSETSIGIFEELLSGSKLNLLVNTFHPLDLKN